MHPVMTGQVFLLVVRLVSLQAPLPVVPIWIVCSALGMMPAPVEAVSVKVEPEIVPVTVPASYFRMLP